MLKIPQRVRAEPGRLTHFGAFQFKISAFDVANHSLFGSRSPNHHTILGGDKVTGITHDQPKFWEDLVSLSLCLPSWWDSLQCGGAYCARAHCVHWVIRPWSQRSQSPNHDRPVELHHCGTISVKQSSCCSTEARDDIPHLQATTESLSVPHLMC